MPLSGATDLPFTNGPVQVGADNDGHTCMVTIRTENPGTIYVYPFIQPQPAYIVDKGRPVTDNGVQILAQLTSGINTPVRVLAGYELLGALLIAPDGLLLPDLTHDVLHFRRDYVQHQLVLDTDRCGLAAHSEIWFSEGFAGEVQFQQLAAPPSSERNWVHG